MTTDSAGTPWAGRVLTGTGFDTDSGVADPALAAALLGGDERSLVAAVAGARLLVPVVAVLGELAKGPDAAHTVEKSTDMAVVTLTAPDGRRALPVFSSTATLAAWDRDARPVPVTAARAAAAALAEDCQCLVLDLGSDRPSELRESMVWALARGEQWLPPSANPLVGEAVSRAVADVEDVRALRLDDEGPVLRIRLGVRPGLDAAALDRLSTVVAQGISADVELRRRVDEIALSIDGI